MQLNDSFFMIMVSKSLMDKLGGFGKNSPFSDKIRLCGWVHKTTFDLESRMGINKGDIIIFDLPLHMETFLHDLFLNQDQAPITISNDEIVQSFNIKRLSIEDLSFVKEYE